MYCMWREINLHVSASYSFTLKLDLWLVNYNRWKQVTLTNHIYTVTSATHRKLFFCRCKETWRKILHHSFCTTSGLSYSTVLYFTVLLYLSGLHLPVSSVFICATPAFPWTSLAASRCELAFQEISTRISFFEAGVQLVSAPLRAIFTCLWGVGW